MAGEFRADYRGGNAFNDIELQTDWRAGRLVTTLDFELGVGWRSVLKSGLRGGGFFHEPRLDTGGLVLVDDSTLPQARGEALSILYLLGGSSVRGGDGGVCVLDGALQRTLRRTVGYFISVVGLNMVLG